MNKRRLLSMMLIAVMAFTTTVFGADTLKGNPNSKIYHKSACKHYASKGATKEFKTEAEAAKAGYTACKRCGETPAKADKKK